MTARRWMTACCALLAIGASGVFGDEAKPTDRPIVRVETSLGSFTIELNAEIAPLTVINFVRYVSEGYYDGTVFHRVTEDVIQGGGYTPEMAKKKDGLHDPIGDESRRGLDNEKYTIAMFRDPLKTLSTQTQFFINLRDNTQLDKLRDGTGYTVFGKVIEGKETIDKIAAVDVGTYPTYAAGRSAVVPKTPVVISKIAILSPLDRKAANEAAQHFQQKRDDPLGFLLQKYAARTENEPVTVDSGLTYLVLKEGTGAFPTIEDTVEINFQGMLVDGEAFDNSVDRWDGPGKVELSSLIPGLRDGISMMREGGVRLIVIPPDLAFGAEGIPARVPSNATVVFEVELLGVTPTEATP